jgi:hypothetical protein
MKSGMSIMFDNPWRKGPRSIHEQVPHIEERRAKHQDRRSMRVEDAKSGSFHVSSALIWFSFVILPICFYNQ